MTAPDAAVLFDMDGLLIDSEPLWLEAETDVMARLGAGWTEADQHALLGGSLPRTVRYLLAKATRPQPPEVIAGWLMSDIEDRVRRDGVPLRPGARELLTAVAAAGLPHALVTSSEGGFMRAVLDSTGLSFDVTVCADDVSATKPDPEPYLLAAKLLCADPARCAALEDSPNGVASAEAAGCRVFAVPSLLPIPPGPGRTVAASLRDLCVVDQRVTSCGIGGLAPRPARRMRRTLEGTDGRRGMSGTDKVIWLVCCGGLTGLGLIVSWLVARRRGPRAGLRWAGWSLLPLAVYLTGADEMFWKIGVAIGDFARGFAFSTRVWSGIALAGLAVVLLVSSGAVRGRQKVKQGKDTAPVRTGGAVAVPGTSRGSLTASSPSPAAGAATQPAATAKLPQRRKPAAASGDDDMSEVEEILRRRGIS